MHVVWRNLFLAFLLSCACGVSAAADQAPAVSEEQFRQMLHLPADAKLVYQAEDGSALTYPEFKKRADTHVGFEIIKDLTKGTATLRFGSHFKGSEEKIATRMPAIDFTDIAGRRIRSADLAHKPSLFSFFFDSCVPCIKEVPILNAFARQHPEYNYLAITFDSKTAAQGFVKQHKLEWPVVADAKKFIESVGVSSFPTYLLVGADGRLLAHGSGLDERAMTDIDFGLREFERWVAKGRATP